ncbi:MAG: hypothetical protein KDC30_07695, partial [Saprospiraceae bacterium]|nr:hypothetical protein [Saprospiraceae bacterium]
MAHINLRPLWAVLFSLALAIPSYAQVTIWSEDFSGYAPGTMNAPGLWTSTGTDCDDPGLNIGNQFGVFGGQFVVNEVEGAPCCSPAGGGNDNSFETVPINISGYCTVEFSMNTGSSGDLECLSAGMPLWGCTGVTATDDFHDQMVIEYDLDGTTFQAAYFCGDNGIGPVSVTGLMGNTLVIRIFAANKFGNETYTFDDILVQGILPQAPALNIPQTTFCQTGASVPLGNVQSGVSGTWSGVGVSANQFNPTLAGPGTFTLTFTPAPGQCALPNTIQVSVTAAPQAFTASDQACLTGPAAIFDLTTLNSIVNGGSGAPVSWYLDPNANVPINNPSSYATPVTSNVYAVVTVGGCNSFPVAVTLTINTCNVMPPVLACNPAGSQSVCEICEDDMTPNEVVNLYVFFQNPPPQGYDFVLTYGNSQSGFQTFNVMDYTGGPLPFTITDTTIFYISSLTCPNGCSDFIGLGNQVVFVYNQAPAIDDPGDLEGCGSVVLPPITGMNIPGDAAYYTQPNGGGTAYLP